MGSKKEVSPGPCPETSRKRKRGVVARKSSRSAEIAVNSGQDFHRIFSEGLEVTKMLPSIIQLVSAYSLGDDYEKKLKAKDVRFKCDDAKDICFKLRLAPLVEPFWIVSSCNECQKLLIVSQRETIKIKTRPSFCQNCKEQIEDDFFQNRTTENYTKLAPIYMDYECLQFFNLI